MMSTIDLSKQTNIYLYGGQEMVREQIRQNLLERGYRCPIDINSDSIKKMGRPCEDSVVVICLTDATKHDKIAEMLYRVGFEYILFLSTDRHFSREEQRFYRCRYNDFLMGQYENIVIPHYARRNEDCYNEDIIAWRDNYVSFWCDEIYIKTWLPECKEELNCFDKTKIVKIEDNIYMSLFRFLKGEETDIADYLRFQCPDKHQYANFMENRKNLYNVYCNNFIYNMSFFEDGPSKVYWNDENNCFVVNDGLHRICFLKQEGLNKYPIVASIECFKKYRKSKYGTKKLMDGRNEYQ